MRFAPRPCARRGGNGGSFLGGRLCSTARAVLRQLALEFRATLVDLGRESAQDRLGRVQGGTIEVIEQRCDLVQYPPRLSKCLQFGAMPLLSFGWGHRPVAASPGSAPSPWMIAGISDFDGDGMRDILWYNTTTGQVVIWWLNGTSVIRGGSPGSAASPWTVAGTGDFNGDGLSDILWYNTTSGQLVAWLLDAVGSVIGGGSLGSVGSPWTVAETGDFNGDGKSDVLWYNPTSGQLLVWLLDGTSVIGGGSPGSAGSPWLIQGMNSD
jgi:hypothetical protein